MREIMFRGKNLDNPEEWLYGYIIPVSFARTFMVSGKGYSMTRDFNEVSFPCHRVLDRTICQKTGLKDCNGVDIWEGDILMDETQLCKSIHKNYYVVEWLDDGFVGRKIGDQYDKSEEALSGLLYYHVIGNIHDNEELLKNLEGYEED